MTVKKTIDVDGGVLVGHDGSVAAGAALLTAAQMADALGTHVTVARAWNLVSAPRPASWSSGYVPALEEFEASALAALEHDISHVRTQFPDLTITGVVVHGSAAEKLIEASERVELLVVGSRGRGGFAGMLLGSVSEQVVRYAQCRVLVDRGVRREPAEAGETGEADQLEEALLSELKLGDSDR